MEKTTYTCDKCKTECDKGKLHQVVFGVLPVGTALHDYSSVMARNIAFRADWCVPCLVLMGAAPEKLTQPLKDVGSIGDQLEEFILEIVQEAMDGN